MIALRPVLSLGARRMRRLRARRRLGACCVTLEVSAEERDRLLACGALSFEQQLDTQAIARAIHKLLSIQLLSIRAAGE